MTTLRRQTTRKERVVTLLRYSSNILVIVGYFFLMNVDVTLGLTIKLLSASLVLPWLIDNKIWDGVTVMSIMTVIDLHKFIEILFY